MAKKKRLDTRSADISAVSRYLLAQGLIIVFLGVWTMLDVAVGNSLGSQQKVVAVLLIPVLLLGFALCFHAWAFYMHRRWAYPVATFILSRHYRWIKSAFGVDGLLNKPAVRLAFGYPPLADEIVYDDYGYSRSLTPTPIPLVG